MSDSHPPARAPSAGISPDNDRSVPIDTHVPLHPAQDSTEEEDPISEVESSFNLLNVSPHREFAMTVVPIRAFLLVQHKTLNEWVMQYFGPILNVEATQLAEILAKADILSISDILALEHTTPESYAEQLPIEVLPYTRIMSLLYAYVRFSLKSHPREERPWEDYITQTSKNLAAAKKALTDRYLRYANFYPAPPAYEAISPIVAQQRSTRPDQIFSTPSAYRSTAPRMTDDTGSVPSTVYTRTSIRVPPSGEISQKGDRSHRSRHSRYSEESRQSKRSRLSRNTRHKRENDESTVKSRDDSTLRSTGDYFMDDPDPADPIAPKLATPPPKIKNRPKFSDSIIWDGTLSTF